MTRYDTAVLADTPLLYWPLLADANDTSGNARHGTVNGSWNFNQANATFPGVPAGSTAGSSSYIVSPSIAFPTGAITVEMIADTVTTSVMLWSIGANVIDLWCNGQMQWNGPGMAGQIAASPPNATHHLVFVFTQAAANSTGCKMYVDGQLAAQVNLSGTAPTLGTQTTRISGWSYDTGYRFAAGHYVSNYAVYAGELTSTRIAAHYAETNNPFVTDNFADARSIITVAAKTATFTSSSWTTETGEPLTNGPALKTGWLTFTPASSGPCQIDTIGSGFDTALAIYTGSALGTLTLFAADDSSGGSGNARIRRRFVAGTTYYIQVGGANGATGGTGQVTFAGLGAFNDDFLAAGAVDVGSNVLGAKANPNPLVLQTLPAAETILAGCDLAVAPSGTVTLTWDLQASQNSGGNGKQQTWRIRRDGLGGAILASRATNASIDSSAGNDSSFAWASSYSDTTPTTGHYVLTGQATLIATSQYIGKSTFTASGAGASTVGYTTETGEPLTMPVAATGWCYFIPTANGRYQFDTIGSNFDTGLAIYSGSALNALSLLASDNDSGGSSTSKAAADLIAGTVYSIQIGSGSGTVTGNVTLNVSVVSYVGGLIMPLLGPASIPRVGYLFKGRSTWDQDQLAGA